MMMPEALAASAMGAAGGPAVVFPSVNITMTLALDEAGSNSPTALVKASAWLVGPPAVRASTAASRSATEVISWVSAVAVPAKLTMPMRLPEPMIPSAVPSVASSMISMKVFAPTFRSARGWPAMLPERSSTSTMSVGLVEMSGAADRARVTFKVPPQSI